jgi:hypothetical protein
MPYTARKLNHQYEVVNEETGKVHAKRTTKTKAEKQLRLLRGIESGKWMPAGSYREFVSQQMKKRPTDVLAKDYMKTIGAEWRKIKGKGEPILLEPGLSSTAALYTRAF